MALLTCRFFTWQSCASSLGTAPVCGVKNIQQRDSSRPISFLLCVRVLAVICVAYAGPASTLFTDEHMNDTQAGKWNTDLQADTIRGALANIIKPAGVRLRGSPCRCSRVSCTKTLKNVRQFARPVGRTVAQSTGYIRHIHSYLASSMRTCKVAYSLPPATACLQTLCLSLLALSCFVPTGATPVRLQSLPASVATL